LVKDYKAYLRHILDSIILIEEYTASISFAEFEKDRKTIDAVIRNFEIIGEASGKLPKEFREAYPQIPWRSMIGLRNILIHEYFGVDVAAVWENIKQILPQLKERVKSVIDSEQK
jgi:uncharacterized protein with HEPN domain